MPDQKSILMPIGDATEMMDTLYPFFRLAEEGYEVVIAGPEARMYHGVMHEIRQTIPFPGISLGNNLPITFKPALPSAMSTQPYMQGSFSREGGPRNTFVTIKICSASPDTFSRQRSRSQLPATGLKLLRRPVAWRVVRQPRWPSANSTSRNSVASYVNQPVVEDGMLITSRTWHDYGAFFKPFIKRLKETE